MNKRINLEWFAMFVAAIIFGGGAGLIVTSLVQGKADILPAIFAAIGIAIWLSALRSLWMMESVNNRRAEAEREFRRHFGQREISVDLPTYKASKEPDFEIPEIL